MTQITAQTIAEEFVNQIINGNNIKLPDKHVRAILTSAQIEPKPTVFFFRQLTETITQLLIDEYGENSIKVTNGLATYTNTLLTIFVQAVSLLSKQQRVTTHNNFDNTEQLFKNLDFKMPMYGKLDIN